MAPPVGLAQRIGVVDMQRLIESSAAGIALIGKAELQTREEREAREAIGRLLEQVEIGDQIEGVRRARSRYGRRPDFSFPRKNPAHDRALGKIRDEVQALIERLGAERGYDLIFDQRGVGTGYLGIAHDLTDEVLRLHDGQVRDTSQFRSIPTPP
jgi:Skp family chaperone for outer membrane proteins